MIDMEPWEGSKPPATSCGGEASFLGASKGADSAHPWIDLAITADLPGRVVD
jgi:hypothetical protein